MMKRRNNLSKGIDWKKKKQVVKKTIELETFADLQTQVLYYQLEPAICCYPKPIENPNNLDR